MKKHNLLVMLALGAAVVSCNDGKKVEKNLYSINTSHLKQLYHSNDVLKLDIKADENAKIDSVAYYLNDKRIGSSVANKTLEYGLSKEKFGPITIQAMVFHNAEAQEVSTKIELAPATAPKILKYKILNTYPHDLKAYTQGLEFHNSFLYESTGNGEGAGTRTKGISSVRKTNAKTGEVLLINELPESIFGEGLTILNNKIYQLTYLNNEAYVYNLETLEKEQTLPYFKNMEGWGLTNDGTNLYMTDGTEQIHIVDPTTLKQIDYINIYTHNAKVPGVNELEWVNGKIYANFYGSAAIAIIDPTTGAVEAVIDFSDLYNKVTRHPDLDVFNGIAYNPETKTFFVTGKNWDKMFEVEFVEE